MASPEYEAAVEIREAIAVLNETVQMELVRIAEEIHDTPSHHQLWAGQIFCEVLRDALQHPEGFPALDNRSAANIARIAWMCANALHEEEVRRLGDLDNDVPSKT